MFHHVSVMLNETIDYLNIKEDGVYVDCTLGGAGHALYLLNQLNDKGRLIAIDQDLTAIENAKEVLKEHLHKVTFVHNNFRELTNILNELEIDKVDGIYYDLGVSSPQLMCLKEVSVITMMRNLICEWIKHNHFLHMK